MEPVQEELPLPASGTQRSPYSTQAPFVQCTPKQHACSDIPSIKYKNIEQAMGHAIAKQAFSPPSPILPR